MKIVEQIEALDKRIDGMNQYLREVTNPALRKFKGLEVAKLERERDLLKKQLDA